MTRLGARFALVLVIAIIMVVVTSSLAAVFVLQGPRPERAMEPLAQQMLLMVKVATANPADIAVAGMQISDTAAQGERDEHFSDVLTNAFRRAGQPMDAAVTRVKEPASSTASLHLPDGRWLRVPMPDFGPPPDGWRVLTGWLILIVVGSVIVSIFAASKLVKPLRLLESALGEVRPDGTIPHVPETGPVEIRATAQALIDFRPG